VLIGAMAVAGLAVVRRGPVAHAQGAGRAGQAASPGAPGHTGMTADLRIRHQRVRGDGATLGGAPAVAVHLERRRRAGHWKTTVTVTGLDRPSVRTMRGLVSLDNPFVASRLEYEDGQAPRLYNRAGQLVSFAQESDRRLLGLGAAQRRTNWDPAQIAARVGSGVLPPGDEVDPAGLVASPARSAERRERLVARWGAAQGRVRGFDRFVSMRGDVSQEMLVDPSSSLPVELNTIRQGRLAVHARFDYRPDAALGLVRQSARTEEAVGDAEGTRLVTEVEVRDVAFTDGGVQ
jgi:hypothetical protein